MRAAVLLVVSLLSAVMVGCGGTVPPGESGPPFAMMLPDGGSPEGALTAALEAGVPEAAGEAAVVAHASDGGGPGDSATVVQSDAGDGGGDAAPESATPCVPRTCADYTYTCELNVSDGCGGTFDCILGNCKYGDAGSNCYDRTAITYAEPIGVDQGPCNHVIYWPGDVCDGQLIGGTCDSAADWNHTEPATLARHYTLTSSPTPIGGSHSGCTWYMQDPASPQSGFGCCVGQPAGCQ